MSNTRVHSEPESDIFTPSQDPVHWLFRMMLIRETEMKVLELRRDNQILGSTHLCVGQEVVPVLALSALDDRDRVLATYRGHGWALACGVPLVQFFAELMGREGGTNHGRGGSAYLSAPAYRFLGENSIVGAGLPIANGVAMGLEHAGSGGIAVVSFGDGATNQGATHEAIVFATSRKLPVVFICENNSWSEMTPILETVPNAALYERAAAYGLPGALVDGKSPDDLFAVVTTAVARARSGGGPSFIEVAVPRLLGHYNADIEHYRSESDKIAHAERDPLEHLAKSLQEQGRLGADDVARLRSRAKREVLGAVEIAASSPLPDPRQVRAHVVGGRQSWEVPELPSAGKEMAFGLSANQALHWAMAADSSVVMFGEDIAVAGGTFGVTRNLRKEYGDRIFDTPISEAAILGAAVGGAISGLRPIVEIMWSDFLMVAFDQLVNQASNVRYLSSGEVTAPLVVRMQQGITPGSCAQHSQSLEALLAHVPGLKVGLPSTPDDAYSMLRAAIMDPDPVVIIESRALYLDKGLVALDAPVQDVGGARLRREGGDAVIITWGRITGAAIEAAEMVSADGIHVAVLDLRWLAPLDERAILDAASASSGRVLVLHEANVTGGFGAEIVARLSERAFTELSGPVVRIGLPDIRVPAAPTLQDAVLPSADTVAQALREMLAQ